MENQREKSTQKPRRMNWKDDRLLKTFLETCISEVAETGLFGNSLKVASWTKVAEKILEVHRVEVTQKQMKNHYDYLRGKYGAWVRLCEKTGNIYDPTTNTFNLTDEEWQQEILINPKAKELRTSPLTFPDLCIKLFEKNTATGVDVWSPTSRVPRSVDPSPDYSIPDETPDFSTQPNDETPDFSTNHADLESTPSNSNSNAQGESGKKRTRAARTSSSMPEHLHKKFEGALDFLMGNKPDPNSIKECKAKLETLGWEKGSELRQCAICMFSEGANYRETWMLLEENELEDYVKRISKRLKFM